MGEPKIKLAAVYEDVRPRPRTGLEAGSRMFSCGVVLCPATRVQKVSSRVPTRNKIRLLTALADGLVMASA
jgi:hypothetical protein